MWRPCLKGISNPLAIFKPTLIEHQLFLDLPERASIPWGGPRNASQPPPSPPAPTNDDSSPTGTSASPLHFTPSVATASLSFAAAPGGSSGTTTTQLPSYTPPTVPSPPVLPLPIHSSPHPSAHSRSLGSAETPTSSFPTASPHLATPSTLPTSSAPTPTPSPGLTPWEAGLPRGEDIPDWLRAATHLQYYGPYSAYPEALQKYIRHSSESPAQIRATLAAAAAKPDPVPAPSTAPTVQAATFSPPTSTAAGGKL